jgi:rhodanese-related sulfurtransferase
MLRKLVAALAAFAVLASPALAGDHGSYASHAARHGPNGIPNGIYAFNAENFADFFATTNGARSIYAEAVAADIAAGAPQLLLDIRAATDFAKGHVPGAVNIPLAQLFQYGNLSTLPTDGTKIVIICYTGHTASMAMGGLVSLGYNAWVLRFGMMGWNASSSQKVGSPSVSQTILGYGGAIEK